jgi:DNA helicase II / ATP-dependent DNA helicase PcrA
MSYDLIKDLNSQQQSAVEYTKGPLLVLAGAGSGKTRVLTYKAGHLIINQNYSPDNILLVTFTNKASVEMQQRIKKILGSKQAGPKKNGLPFAGTFHSLCAKILRIDGKHIGIPVSFSIYDDTDQLELVKQSMNLLDISLKKFKPRSIKITISSAKNELITPQQYANFARGYFQETAARVFTLYQKLLSQYEAADFDDLISHTVNLFNTNPQVLKTYQNKFKYILVDEYHDTNKAQYQLTKLLSFEHKNLTVVADCSQSIYGWRGADFRNVLNLQNDFPNIKTVNLEQNYRSSKTILKAAFSVIQQNTSHPVLKLWTKNFSGNKINVFEAASEKEEAEFIVEKIKNRSDQDFSDFAILYRTNAQSRVLEESLLHASIPYVLIGGIRFYNRKEIKDCLAYLRLLANPKDRISYKRVEKLGKKRLESFLELAEKINNKKLKTEKILNKVLKATGYMELFDKNDEQDLARIENIKELFSVAKEFFQLSDFLQNVALVEQENLTSNKALVNNNDKKNAVTLMTMHAAKGLEFNTVFMVGMEEGLFPHSRSLLEKEELEEERRLAYVGITRAMKNLYLTYCRRRLYFGTHNFNQISRFITEIDNNLLQLI